MVPKTSARVPRHTAKSVNDEIRRDMDRRLRYYAANSEQIDKRLREIDREWDIERMLEANAATVAFAGVVLGAAVDKRFLALPALVGAFLLQHAVQGWCPPLPVLRRMGYRTMREIDTERFALKALRGDFGEDKRHKSDRGRADHALRAARL
jgi:hypothetical protein